MTGLVVTLMMAVDGGTPFSSSLYAQCPDATDAGEAYPVDGGSPATADWYLPFPRAQRQACLLVTCDERLKQLEAVPGPEPFFSKTTLAVMGGFGLVAFLFGAYLGWSFYGFVH